MAETSDIHEEIAKCEAMAEDGRCEDAETTEKKKKRKIVADDHKEQTPVEAPPEKMELVGWYVFSFCSYFVHEFLVPVLFPLMITQRAWPAFDLPPAPAHTPSGVACSQKEMTLYQRLVDRSIAVDGSKFSPLSWTTVSWAVGVVVAIPILMLIAHHLDHGNHQPPILLGAIVAGGFSCLLTGFFNTNWLFPLYIAAIAVASIIGTAAQARHLGLMVRDLTGGTKGKRHFRRRQAVGSWLSLHGTAAGSLGAAVMAAFTYHMLRRSDQLTSLWVVSIFSGLQWLTGIVYAAFSTRPGSSTPTTPTSRARCAHLLTIFKNPHAIGGLAGVFLSSFACMCVFASCMLYVIGDLCIGPPLLLSLWAIYFTFPVVSLPVLHPVQLVARADAVSMQLLGFFMSAFTSGLGFSFREERWKRTHIILVCLLQSTANGVLYAFGRALLMDCSPAGKEGAIAVWFAWARAAGACAGFAVGTTSPGSITAAFAAALLASLVGVFVLIFGNVSHVGAIVAAGHVKEAENGDMEGNRD
ncbi:uncharacterized protein LOC103970944 [Musa acuminata AAA Group]|uniref:uncharacterized protein LOC103970944 n=1 Tax=Musa acuminata AAA Group TaxID=214697 RepID=UPI0031E14AAE